MHDHLPSSPIPILHNMSVRPDKAISHTGKDLCIRLRFSLQAGVAPEKLTQTMLCRLLEVGAIATSRMREKLYSIASNPPDGFRKLPAICPVIVNAPGDELPGITDDPRIAFAVLARVGHRLFMREREPLIVPSEFARTVSLILPPNWSPTS